MTFTKITIPTAALFALALGSTAQATGSNGYDLSMSAELEDAKVESSGMTRIEVLERENTILKARMAEIEASLKQGGADDDRVANLEAENKELARRIDAVTTELERFSLGSIAPPIGDSQYGLGPAASKIYNQDSGLSIGGYGELLYQNYAGSSKGDSFDLQRAIIYVGYKFNENWVFNSEIEWEHATTSESGSVSMEFAYLDYLSSAEFNVRVGLLLLPMGFINELHEPTTFLSANRPMTERVLIPSTWRENGVGIFGSIGDVSYRTYVVNGLDAAGFTAGGLRGGRQKGSQAMANDMAWVGRLDWEPEPGIVVGASSYYGDSGQGQSLGGGPVGDTSTLIYEAHAEIRARGFHFRALGAMARLSDVAQLNTALGLAGAASVGNELEGYYGEFGFDVLTLLDEGSDQSLTPFVRYEDYNTQASVPTGFVAAAGTDDEIVTFGINYKPISQIVFKLDFADADLGLDQWNALVGYVF